MGVHHKGYVKGGPEMKAALAKMRGSLSNVLLATATAAGAKVLADEWRAQVRGRVNLGPGTAHYVDAIGFRARAGDQGATAYVGLTEDVPISPGESHPREYASRIEFGSMAQTKAQAKAGTSTPGRARPAQPTLRPAIDGSRDKVTQAMADTLRQLLERVG